MRVVWVSHSGEMGGAELCMVEAIEALQGLGVESHVILPRQGPLAEHLTARGVPVTIEVYWWWITAARDQRLSHRLRRVARNALAIRRIRATIRAVDPDVVVTNTITIPVGGVAARSLGVPHLWCLLEFGREDHDLTPDWGDRFTRRQIDKLSTRVCAISEAVRDSLSGWMDPRRIDVVYPSVEVPAHRAAPMPGSGALRIAVVGAKYPGKRQEDAVRAAGFLVAEGIDVHLTLIGREDPEYGTRLRRLVSDLDLSGRVEMRGAIHREAALEAIEHAHVFVMPSRSEAFGRVTVEAMKLGRPVVGADQAGTAELVRDGWNGLLYQAGNARDLAEKLASLDSDRDRLADMGRNAGQWANATFSPERLAADMYAALAATIASGASLE